MFQPQQNTIAEQEVHVWHLLAERAASAVDSLCSLLSPDEHARMARYRHESDRHLYLLSRGMMRTVLASYLGCDCQAIAYSCNAHGKPTLNDGGPGLHFNLTHSHGAIALAVSREREVGIDIESRHRPAEYLLLAERFFAAAESQHLHGLQDAHQREAFFAIWTLKEAFVKGIGRGLSFPLDAFCFELDVNRFVAFKPLADFVSADWHFHQFNLGDQHCGALAVQKRADEIVRIDFHDWCEVFATA